MASVLNLHCAYCRAPINRPAWRVRARQKKGLGGPFCSRRCSALADRALTDAEHFERTVARILANISPEPNSGCWLWAGRVDRMGYAALSMRGRFVNGHRIMWESRHGTIPERMHVCHHCDVPSCINPRHLFLGTDADNAADRARKQRGNRKLTADQALAIYRDPRLQREIAADYGISRGSVDAIKAGRHYGWLTGERSDRVGEPLSSSPYGSVGEEMK